MDQFEDEVRRLAFIREEMRFEIVVLHDRINALISAEAFLTIAFTMALGSADASWARGFVLVAPTLAMIGLALAALAWPGVRTSLKIINEWNALLAKSLDAAPAVTESMWRPSLRSGGTRRADIAHRRGMLFAHAVPVVFVTAWTILAVVALNATWR